MTTKGTDYIPSVNRTPTSPDAGLRVRCKIVLALVRGSSPTDLVRSRMAASSLIYEVMHRFISERLLGLADRREDNGQSKVTEEYEAELFAVVPGSPRNHGYRRPTCDPGVADPCASEANGDTHQPHHDEPSAQTAEDSPGSAQAHRRLSLEETSENQAIAGDSLIDTDEVILYVDEVDIHLNPKIGPDWCCGARKKPS